MGRARLRNGRPGARCAQQARHGRYRERRDAEQASRHVQRLDERSRERDVHAMVVARGEVYGEEISIRILFSSCGVAEQLGGGAMEAFRLEDAPVARDRPGLAYPPVGGAQHSAARPRHARAGLQRAREERVEARVGARIGLDRFAHVDRVGRDDAADQPVLPRAPRPARGPIDDARERTMRQQILQRDGKPHAQPCVPASVARSSATACAANGGRNMPTSRPSGSTITAEPL